MLIVGKYFPEEMSEWLRPSQVSNKKMFHVRARFLTNTLKILKKKLKNLIIFQTLYLS